MVVRRRYYSAEIRAEEILCTLQVRDRYGYMFYSHNSFFIGLLAIVGEPCTFGDTQVREECRERRFFRRAGIDAETYLVARSRKMAYTHLAERHAVCEHSMQKSSSRREKRYHIVFTSAGIAVVAQSE